MEHKEYLLSICMPTYNRADKAYDQLKFFLEETRDMDDIEIIVANNASQDNTEERLLSLKNFKAFSYIKNSDNIGLIRNINVLVKRASGKYIWIIGDDDRFPLGIVARVHSLLSSNEKISGIYINTNRPEKKLRFKSKLPARTACAKVLPVIKGGFLFISANVVEAGAMKRIYRLVDKNIEEAMSVPMLCQFVAAEKKDARFEIIKERTIVNDAVNISWKSHQYKVAVKYNTAIFFYLEMFGYSRQEAKKLARKYYIAEGKRIFLEMLKHFKSEPAVVVSDFCWYIKKFPITTFMLMVTMPVRSIVYLAMKKLRANYG